MKTDDDRRVGGIVIDVVHVVGVITLDAPEGVDGCDKLALEGIDSRALLLPGTDNRLRALMGGDEGTGDVSGGATLRGSDR